MKLLTKAIRDRLIKNSDVNLKRTAIDGNTEDFKPVVKFFNPTGAATWLITELDPITNNMYGLCDTGLGFPELGYVNFEELATCRVAFGLGIERDMYWTANKTLSEYASEARSAQRIVA